jgi:hypothetical protein
MDANFKNGYSRRTSCRICDGKNLELFLSLGEQPLANGFLNSPDDFQGEKKYRLDVYRCKECSLVQLLDVISPEILFREYLYVTGPSETMARHNRRYAKGVVSELGLDEDDLVIEVASNDGSLLSCLREQGVRTLGIEPARNIAAVACERGIDTIDEFFNFELAANIRSAHGVASAVVANNVLAHVDEPRNFLLGCRELINEGFIITEFPYLGELLEKQEYDTVYHEHLCYFSLMALIRLYQEVGLTITQVKKTSVHGGSIRVYATRKSESWPHHARDVLDMAEQERQLGYHTSRPYEALSRAVRSNRNALLKLLTNLKNEGNLIAAYGASAKGNTLLNYCGINTKHIDYIVDQNPLKVGLYTPGTHIPVMPVSTLESERPNYILILAWNYAEEIMEGQSEFTNTGGKFILPIPSPMVTGA